jgi:hypothetical protein
VHEKVVEIDDRLSRAAGFNHVATSPRHGGSREYVALFEIMTERSSPPTLRDSIT